MNGWRNGSATQIFEIQCRRTSAFAEEVISSPTTHWWYAFYKLYTVLVVTAPLPVAPSTLLLSFTFSTKIMLLFLAFASFLLLVDKSTSNGFGIAECHASPLHYEATFDLNFVANNHKWSVQAIEDSCTQVCFNLSPLLVRTKIIEVSPLQGLGIPCVLTFATGEF